MKPKADSIHEGMLVVAAVGAMFALLFTVIITILAIKGNFPIILLGVVYFTIGLSVYAIKSMIQSNKGKTTNRSIISIS